MHHREKKWTYVYEYYSSKGLWIFIMDRLTSIIIGAVISIIPILLFGCFNVSKISEGVPIHKLFSSFTDGWKNLNIFWKICVFIFMTFNIIQLIQFLYSLPRFIRLYHYYTNTLGISNRDLPTTQWNEVVDHILISDTSHKTSLLTIAQEILREDNYICAIVSDSSLFTWRIPPKKQAQHFPITEAFIYIFKLAMTGIVLSSNGESLVNGTQSMRAPFVASHLRRRFIFLGIFLTLFSPFLLCFQVFYLFLEFAQSLHSSTGTLMYKEWTTEAKWIIREFNELPHLLNERLERSYFFANLYLDQFPSEFILPLAKMASFISGAFLSLLLIFGLFSDINTIMTFPILGGKTIAWLVALLATVYAATSSMLRRDPTFMSAEEALIEVEKWIHHDFRDDSNSAHSWATMDKISKLYQPLWANFLRELFGVILNPLLFLLVLPYKAESIVEFIRKNSIQDPESGWICAFSTFDLSDRGFCGTADQKEKVVRSMRSFDAQGEQNPHVQLLDFSNNEFFSSQSHSKVIPNEDLLSPLYATELTDSQGSNDINEYTPKDFFDNVL
ncbi:autophagy protein [Tritrichomonas foetus]|uniref:Autophagy-related protein 9 n=1 Tax=Tritrichomonas foetus TaxID=1144522 RepID=A0A1J4KBQ7_9EUKA|nr:autophagy protein [Tritrichomonas foetus]|eukprot:OHT08659.1 autophagy protein [Tritrichomonas foetus]